MAQTKINTPRLESDLPPDGNQDTPPMENGTIYNNTINPCTNKQDDSTMSNITEISDKKEKAEKKTTPRIEVFQKVEKMLSEKKIPETKIDQARIGFYFLENLRGKESKLVDYYT